MMAPEVRVDAVRAGIYTVRHHRFAVIDKYFNGTVVHKDVEVQLAVLFPERAERILQFAFSAGTSVHVEFFLLGIYFNGCVLRPIYTAAQADRKLRICLIGKAELQLHAVAVQRMKAVGPRILQA